MPRQEETFRGTEAERLTHHNVFCHIAGIYDLMNLLISFGLIRSWRRYVARSLALRTGETWLDLGTGTADLAIALMRASEPNTRIIGIDLSPEMLEQGRLKLRRRGLHNRISLRIGDAEHLALPDNSVDGCCSAFLIRNLDDLSQSFRETLRVVRPHGRIVCLEVNHPANKVFRRLFHFYFYKCAPFCGAILGQKFNAYQYLPASLKNFPDAPALKKTMEECGWSDVHIHYLHGGMVAMYEGTKRDEEKFPC